MLPVMAVAGADKTKWLAANPLTTIAALTPVALAFAESVTVTVSFPPVRSTAAKKPMPPVKVALAGSPA